MNRRTIIGIAICVALVVTMSVLSWRGGKKLKEKEVPARPAEIKKSDPFAEAGTNAKAPTGFAPRWGAMEDREGPLRLEGQVLGPGNTPVGNAKVWIDTEPSRVAETEADGTFAFDKLVGRTFQLTADSGELVGGPVRYKLTATSDPVVIRLGPGAAVAVTVVDEQTQPVADAFVAAGEHKTKTTDAKGVATLQPLPPGWISVRVRKDGFADSVGYATVASGASMSLTIVMKKGFLVSGIVVDTDGKPISKVKVAPTNARWGFGDDEAHKPVVTNDKGAFTVGYLAPGTHTLSAFDGEHSPAQSPLFTVADKPITDVKITMKAGAVLAGTVVTADKKPSAFAVVRVAGKGSNAWQETARQTTTDEKGVFELRGLPMIPVQARAESDAAASHVADVDLTTKSVTDLQLVLDVTGTISGTVVDHTGAPLPEIQVNAFPDLIGGNEGKGLAIAGMSSATTDGGGAFAIRGLPDGKYRLWPARSAGSQWGGWGTDNTPATTGDTNVKIVLPAPGSLKATIVLDGDSKPPAPAYIEVGQQAPSPATDGVFDMKEVDAGTFDVQFRGPQFASLTKRAVKIEPGKTTDLGTITVYRGRKLVGKVISSAGQPVAGAKIRVGEMLFSAEGQDAQMDAVGEAYGVRSAVTDREGGFSIIGLDQKATNVIAEHAERGSSIAVPVPAGADDPPAITLKLRGYGSISGKITMGGKPLSRAAISHSAKGGGAALAFVQSNDDGTYQLNKVPEGDVVIQVMRQQMRAMKSHSVNTHVTAGKQVVLDIDVPVGSIELTVTIAAKAGATVNAAQVFLFEGTVVFASGKELNDNFGSGGAKGMKFWFGTGPMPAFDELVPGAYSICTIPITGDMQDPTFQQRLQQNIGTLAVYCKAVNVPATPAKQAVTQELPSMNPLPTP